jgi:aryl-alcohol dehydrogenase-like predicted oxidoreductase
MQYRNVQDTRVSAISLGSWKTFGSSISEEQSEACLLAAHEEGINFFDGGYADGDYIVGRVMRKHGWDRESLILSGKTGRPVRRETVMDTCERLLERYGTDYVDFFYCRKDPDADLLELARTMDELVRDEKVRYWGTTMFHARDIEKLYELADEHDLTPPTVEQPWYNLLGSEIVTVDYELLFRERGLRATVFSPLNHGLLTGKYNDVVPEGARLSADNPLLDDEMLQKLRKLEALANRLGISMAAMSLAWCLKNPGVASVITGATRPEQVRENARASEYVDLLDGDVMREIHAITEAGVQPDEAEA